MTGLVPNDNDTVRCGLCSPDLPGPAEELADVARRVWQREGLEDLGRGIETHERIVPEIGQPHLVRVVDIHRISLRAISREAPLSPFAARGVIHRHLARVPLADPNSAA